MKPIEEIESWSKTLSPWRQDCLRRLATMDDVAESDIEDLLAIIKANAGFPSEGPAPITQPFEKAHFGSSDQTKLVLKGVRNIQNVNRLTANASMSFHPSGLTVIYGRNGSGKSGFSRVLRSACRTRIDDRTRLNVLGDAYQDEHYPLSAKIVIDKGDGEAVISWTPETGASPQLASVSVFDTSSAQLYVDGGNQIHFLPFGLALPHRLNSVAIELQSRLEQELKSAVDGKIELTKTAFSSLRETESQKFDGELHAQATDAEITNATTFDKASQTRLDQISGALTQSASTAADISALLTWTEALAKECSSALELLSTEKIDALHKFRADLSAKRKASEIAAGQLFPDEPLSGVGSATWRELWVAARDYSVDQAYPDQEFPVTEVAGEAATCVLCQQPLELDAAERMKRFKNHITDALRTAVETAETSLQDMNAALPKLTHLLADDFPDRLEQVRSRDDDLADQLSAFRDAASERREMAQSSDEECSLPAVPAMPSIAHQTAALVASLTAELKALQAASDVSKRESLLTEKAELEDRKALASNKANLIKRRDLLVTQDGYERALADVRTTGTTKRANEFIDKHLTSAVKLRFEAECDRFEASHLKVELSRKSGRTMAAFDTHTKSKWVRAPSQILSEGEQRSLALAGFLTEVSLTEGSGAIILDDPVSSLDRDRSQKVADRLAEEALLRQVIVFTHDIIFFNELCASAEQRQTEPEVICLFSDNESAGKIDPFGMVWKGLNAKRRIGKIKSDFAPLKKLTSTSPSEYEFAIKNLYGRLRDTYERVVEEVIFCDIVRRGVDTIQTQKLRFITLSDDHAIRFHTGMTNANTHSHDNPASDTVLVPPPDKFEQDLAALEQLIIDLRAASENAEAARPQMKPKQ
jgi:energy-coupling factor transporter ATP-binding protein EcfA2